MNSSAVIFRWLCLPALLLALAGCSRAPHTADEVIEKYFTATGGRDRLTAVRDMVGTGGITLRRAASGQQPAFERRGNFVMIFKRPDKMRTELALGAMSQLTMFDGEHGWSAAISTNVTRVAAIEGEALKQLRFDAIDSNDQLLTYKQRGLSARLLGPTTIANFGSERYQRECVGVELTGTDQPARQIFFDTETGLILKTIRGNGEVFLGDFRPVNGIVTTMHMLARNNKTEIEFRFADVKFNIGVADGVFRPEPKK